MDRLFVKTKLFAVATGILLNLSTALAQNNDLGNKEISVDIKKGTVKSALNQIDKIEGVTLSFDPTIIGDQLIQAKNFVNIKIKTVMGYVLGNNYSVKFIDGYTIIQAKEKELVKNPVGPAKSNSGPNLPEKEPTTVPIPEAKALNQDTIIQDSPVVSQEPLPLKRIVDSKDTTVTNFNTLTSKTRYTRKNEPFQVSVIPGVGTLQYEDSATDVNYSLNILGGHLRSVKGFEFAGLHNKEERSVTGVQIAGLGNRVGLDVNGVEVAGILNRVDSDVKGGQITGGANMVSGAVRGIQIAGVYSTSGDSTSGVQISGGSNISAGSMSGIQASAGANITKGDHIGSQLTGGVNIASGEVKGAQVAGLINHSKGIDGVQIAGIGNINKGATKGAQIGLYNYSKKLNGIQIGLINKVDTLRKGLTIGVFNLVKNGKVEFGIGTNDVEHLRLAFRTGSNGLYNIYSTGVRFLPTDDDGNQDSFLWTYGFGFGSQKNFGNSLFGNIELTSTMIHNSKRTKYRVNLLNRLHLNLGVDLGKLTITGGPILNVFVTEVFNTETGEPEDLAFSESFYNTNNGHFLIRGWIGYDFSINF